jgi:hypothetical protein
MEAQTSNGNGVHKTERKRDSFIPLSEEHQVLLNESKKALEEEEQALGNLVYRFEEQKRLLQDQIKARKREAATLLDMMGRLYLSKQEGGWDYSPARGGFVLGTEEKESK